MSIAILPSTPASFVHPPLAPIMTSPAKRPKLSLDTTTTSSTSLFTGKHSTSLRLETLSATSPTIRNTFGNAYASQKPKLSALITTTDVNPSKRRYVPTPQKCTESDAESPTSSPVRDQSVTIPYNVSFHINSILRNGPAPRARRLKSLAHTRPLATAKKVVFRAPLTEEVKNVKYTLSHFDIEPPTPTQETPAPELDTCETQEVDDQQLLQPTTYVAQSSKVLRVSDPDSCPSTPVAGRRKKDRHWQWTLGPVDSSIVTAESPRLLAIDAV